MIDIRDSDPERDVIDLITAVLAANEEEAHPPPRFRSGSFDIDPLIDLESEDLVPAQPRSRLRR